MLEGYGFRLQKFGLQGQNLWQTAPCWDERGAVAACIVAAWVLDKLTFRTENLQCS